MRTLQVILNVMVPDAARFGTPMGTKEDERIRELCERGAALTLGIDCWGHQLPRVEAVLDGRREGVAA